jgi:hypothetical protein
LNAPSTWVDVPAAETRVPLSATAAAFEFEAEKLPVAILLLLTVPATARASAVVIAIVIVPLVRTVDCAVVCVKAKDGS